MKKFLLAALLTVALPPLARAQRLSVGTNCVDWLTFGTMNAEASVSVARRVSIHAGGELNPWTFNAGDRDTQAQLRQATCWAGARWWPWHVYSGWWIGGDGRYSAYNSGGITARETEEGDAFGGGLYGGYAVMLSDNWNLDLGLGAWGGYTRYTRYACPRCGVTLDQGGKAFILPDARLALQLIF
ncbi:MAG: DUF3575 domain-containing protein [Bacteroidales bacterium]|nr:DUF3575 domain-containing protein [Bacteroidales bacterium]